MSTTEKGLLWHPVQKRDNFFCQYCGKDGLESLDNWHDSVVDHFHPWTSGGSNDEGNLKTSCGYCNAIKGDRVFETIEEARRYISKRRAELQKDFERVKRAVRG